MSLYTSLLNTYNKVTSNLDNAAHVLGVATQKAASELTFGLVKAPQEDIIANTGNATLNKVLEAGANHPALTASLGTIAAAPAASLSLAKSAGSAAASAFSTASLGTKAAIVVGTPIALGAVSQSPKLRKDIISAPTALVNFGQNVGGIVEEPSLYNVSKTFKENPAVSSIVGGAAVLGIGLGGSSLISNYLNTKAVKENTKIMTQGTQLLGSGNIGGSETIGTSKYDVDIAQEQTKQLQAQLKSQENLAKMQLTAANSAAPVASSSAVAPIPTKKATKKKKTSKKKSKKKKATKKKAKKKAKKTKTLKRKTSKRKK